MNDRQGLIMHNDNGFAERESDYSLRDIFGIVWKRLWIVALVSLICVGAAVAFSLAQEPVYEASAKLIVGQEPADGDQQGPLSGSVEGLQQLTQTMVEVVYTRPVAEEVIRQLELETTPEGLLDNLTVEQIDGNLVIQLSYAGSDPEEAQEIVNAVGDVSSERISEVSASSAAIKATVLEYAIIPETPTSPNPSRSALLALAVGLMLGVGLTFLLEHLDDSWRSSAEVEQVSGVPTFGAIPEFERARRRKGKGKPTT